MIRLSDKEYDQKYIVVKITWKKEVKFIYEATFKEGNIL